jgi:hypothetical protein
MTTPKYASINGEIVAWENANVHVASAGFKLEQLYSRDYEGIGTQMMRKCIYSECKNICRGLSFLNGL